jgi:uncharacterized protein (DUF952 family)
VRTTYHLVAEPVWTSLDPSQPYTHASLASEGFIHCTDGAANLRDTANRFYRDDPRPFLVLTIDLDSAGSPWRIDDPGLPFPHVYGAIDRSAIVAVRRMPRRADGAFELPERD